MVDGADDRHMDRLTEPDFLSNDRFLQHVSYAWCRRASPGRAPCQGKATCLPKFQCVAVILDSAGTPKIPSHRPEDTRKWNDNVSALDYEGDAIEQRERVDGRRHVVVKLASFQDVSDHRRKGGGMEASGEEGRFSQTKSKIFSCVPWDSPRGRPYHIHHHTELAIGFVCGGGFWKTYRLDITGNLGRPRILGSFAAIKLSPNLSGIQQQWPWDQKRGGD